LQIQIVGKGRWQVESWWNGKGGRVTACRATATRRCLTALASTVKTALNDSTNITWNLSSLSHIVKIGTRIGSKVPNVVKGIGIAGSDIVGTANGTLLGLHLQCLQQEDAKGDEIVLAPSHHFGNIDLCVYYSQSVSLIDSMV